MGCDVGKLLRDDDAKKMAMLALNALRFQRDDLVTRVIAAAMAAIKEERPQEAKEEKIRQAVTSLLAGEQNNDFFFQLLPITIFVYKDRHMELRFQNLPQVFYFEES